MARLVLFFLFITNLLSAQPLNLLNYNVGEGLSQSQAWCILQDRKGYLWCGTQGGGLNRFDGVQFEQFSVEEGLPSAFIYALYEDRKGRLWAGTSRGAAWFDGQRFHAAGDNQLQISSFAENASGELLAGTPGGVYNIDLQSNTTKSVAITGNYANPVVQTLFSSGKSVFAGTSKGAYTDGKLLGVPWRIVTAFCEDHNGDIWVGSNDGYLARYAAKTGQLVQQFENLGKITCVFSDREQKIWVGTQNDGIVILHPGDSTRSALNENNGLPHPYVRQIMADREGHIWIATSGGGLVRRLDQPFRHFSTAQGLSGSRIYAIAEAPDSSIWWSAAQNGLQWLDASGIHRFTGDSGLLSGFKCKSLCFDQRGRLWVGTEGKGLIMLDTPGVVKFYTSREGMPSNWIQKVFCDRAGTVWAATFGEGLAKITPEPFSVRTFGWLDGMPDLRVNAVATDSNGDLWVGFQSGHIACFSQDKIKKVFGPDQGLSGAAIRAMVFDRQGRLWVGGRESGLMVSDGRQFKAVALPSPLSSQIIYSLVFDQSGRLWVGCENGVNQLVINENGVVESLAHFSKNEGFLGIETCHDAAVCDRSGSLWFGTMNGLTQRLPFESAQRKLPPVIHYEQISLFYKSLDQTPYAVPFDPLNGLSGILQLPYHQNHLSFSFSAIDLDHPERIRYRWKLDNAETDWSPWSEQRQINYANLSPGEYSFRVQATANTGQIAEGPEIKFVIEKPFWQRWPFRLAVLGLLALVVWLSLRAYIQRIRTREEQRRQQLEMEHNLLQLEQKALQLQMNPHFIFNALTAIQGVVAQQDTTAARREISNFAKLMRSILSNSRKPEITLREEADTLSQYLEVEQFCRENKFIFHITFDPDIDPDDIKIPPMLLQPFVENAVVHGVANLGRPGTINVHFTIDEPFVRCVIEDNGIGREAAAQRRQERKPGHQPAAMQITRERLDSMKKREDYHSLVVTDVLDEEGNVCGTRVMVSYEL